ncbi:hypothetical protein FG385_17970 [Amycolatopsis alkalitolerans]|uniref:Tetratricopeptide repeat protein n=1 Tax=Amycolatopsis alkalitolerans TaxID=2547244 RepID=A0A5C4M3F4_9PSEU|nr:hypothetical protein FG385_17970 [Amycolatopsis alkalitolerans]
MLRNAAGLGLRAPELTVILGERAASLAEAAGSDKLWARAESLVVSGRVRLGLRADTVGRAVAALRSAEDLGETALAAGLRSELAVCSRSVGVPLTGLAVLRPVLGVDALSGAAKAAALCQLVGCLSQFGRKPELDRTLTEADRLCASDDDLDGDERLLARALVRVAISGHRRRHADVMGAADAARTGLGLLEQLEDPGCDGGVVRVRLILQLVCSLLDRGDTENAAEIAESVLTDSPRAAAVAPLGWLRMAVATRVLLPSGSVEAAAVVLRDAVHSTERHGLYSLTARLWAELAYVEERLGRASEAIECLHQSRAAEHVYARSRRQAMGLLAGAFGTGSQAEFDLDDVLAPRAQAPGGSARRAADAVAGGLGAASDVPGLNGAGTHLASRSAAQAEQKRQAAAEQTVILPRIIEPSDERRSARVVSAPKAGKRRAEDKAVAVATAKGGVDATAPPVRLTPVRVEHPEVPDLPLAPPPADEPVAERKAAGRPDEPATRKTRHDATHGSVTARSVLDRLGISTGSGGGRRRAVDETDDSQQTANVAPNKEAVGRQGSEGPASTGAAAGRQGSRELSSAGGVADSARQDEQLAAGRDVEPADSARHDGSAVGGLVESARRQESANGGPANLAQRDGLADGGLAKSARRDGSADGGLVGSARRQESADGGLANLAQRDASADGGPVGSAQPEPSPEADEPAWLRELADSLRNDELAETRGSAEPSRGKEIADSAPGVNRAEVSRHREPDESTQDTQTADQGDHGEETAKNRSNAGSGESPSGSPERSLVVNDPWLPRLKLPPSLEPFESVADDVPASMSETHFTNTPVIEDDGLGEPFRDGYTGSPALEEDLPADAGLADLLARALAEHQAGTSSAAALVKRLGNQGSEERRTLNGHGRNGEPPANGRHRGDR